MHGRADMSSITSIDGDVVDLICYNHYGYTAGVTEQVLEQNRGLADHGPVLPAGVVITLPDPPAQNEQQTINLWD